MGLGSSQEWKGKFVELDYIFEFLRSFLVMDMPYFERPILATHVNVNLL